MATCCYECGKEIKGKAVFTNPPIYRIRLGEFKKAYHPKCYVKAEREAEKELSKC